MHYQAIAIGVKSFHGPGVRRPVKIACKEGRGEVYNDSYGMYT